MEYVTLQGSKEELIALIKNTEMDINCGGPKKIGDDTYEIKACVHEIDAAKIVERKIKIYKREKIEVMKRKASKLVSKENRFQNKSSIPTGMGIKENK